MRIKRKTKSFLYFGVLLSAFLCFVILRHTSTNEEYHHHIVKRFVERPPPDDVGHDAPQVLYDEILPPDAEQGPNTEERSPNGGDGSELPPGTLICELPPERPTLEPRPSIVIETGGGGGGQGGDGIDGVGEGFGGGGETIPGIGGGGKGEEVIPGGPQIGGGPVVTGQEGGGTGEILPPEAGGGTGEEILPPEAGGVGTGIIEEGPVVVPPKVRPDVEKPIVTGWVDTRKNIGCCPAGDRSGTPYKEGMSCCVDQIYNATAEFCCLSKARKLEINADNLAFCYPPNRVPFCRLSDLGLEEMLPFTVTCKTTGGKSKDPTDCTFICPEGSQVRGDKKVMCSNVGTWNDADPQCCEGCPATYTQDIWFVVDIDASIKTGNLSNVRSFMKLMLSYLPVSQDRVRVAVTAFNSVVFTTQNTWHLDAQNSHEELNRAIDNLPSEGVGRNTGEALTWLSERGFGGRLGDREDVENTIILITTGPPEDDSLIGAAEVLRGYGRFIVIAVGPAATSPEFPAVVSAPRIHNFLRVPTFEGLDDERSYLYDLLCDEYCLGSTPSGRRKNLG